MSRATAWLTGCLIGLAVASGGYAAGYTQQHPDVTIAPCSAWAATSSPHFTGPVATNMCLTPDGTISVAP